MTLKFASQESEPVARNAWLSPFLFVTLIVLGVLSLLIGRYEISPREVFQILWSSFYKFEAFDDDNQWIVVQVLRLPRILLAVLSGAGLAVAGAALQGIFRNPLVGPEILGVSAGASFGGVLAMSLGLVSPAGLAPLAFMFGCGAITLAITLSWLAGQSSTIGLVLAGVIVGGLFSSLTGLVTYSADAESKLPSIVYWLMGSFARATYGQVAFAAVVALIAIPPLFALSWRINLLSLGELDARALGLKTKKLRLAIVALASLLVASQVAVSGGIGWVGLVIPHLARMLVGPDHVRLLPVSALLGGIYLLLIDDLSRSLSETEIPIGLLTSLVGGPVFAIFFVRLRNRGWNND
ncbi:MAG: iron ABC transporter permease [Deltaproteobacteria bacterium]|jgi:iron complex transport system permease protein|nr:iron ABC transporter permease [Deltaproteobacteria bacterium]